MICYSRFPEFDPDKLDFIKDVAHRRAPYSNNLKVGFWQAEDEECINVILYDMLEIIEATTTSVKQKDTYAVLMERDRLFAVNISAFPPPNYFLFDMDVFLAKKLEGEKLDYIATVSGFYPLPKTYLMKIFLLKRNELFHSFFVENSELIIDTDED
jgi:hypothetical protein